MTFQSFEASVESGQPVEFYTITLGGQNFHYTTAEDIITVAGTPYTPLAMQREKIDFTQEQRSNTLNIKLPGSDAFVRQFITTIPGQRAKVTVKRLQRNDTPTPQTIQMFTGYVQSVTFEEQMKVAVVAVAPEGIALSRPMPRFSYMSTCNHVLGDERCKVNETAFQFVGIVTAVSGNTITVAGANVFPNGYFAAGRVETTGALDRRLVLAHTGSILTLLLPFGVNPLGSTVTCFAGCGHDPDSCFSKFANVPNYGGFKFVPKVNVFKTGLQ